VSGECKLTPQSCSSLGVRESQEWADLGITATLHSGVAFLAGTWGSGRTETFELIVLFVDFQIIDVFKNFLFAYRRYT
jgi:hypothetical protein